MTDSTTKKELPQMYVKKLPKSPEKETSAISPKSYCAMAERAPFKFPSTAPQLSTWNKGKEATDDSNPVRYIKIAIEQVGFPQGSLIYDRVPREDFFKRAPALHQYVDTTDTKIILPANSVDEDTIHDIVTAMVAAGEQKTDFNMYVDKTPVNLIKIHAVFVLFGMKKEAANVLDQAWESMAMHELKPEEVDWIWDTYGVWDSGVKTELETDTIMQQHSADAQLKTSKLWKVLNRNKTESAIEFSRTYRAPYEKEYVEMMAYQILNLDALGKLNCVISRMILDRCLTLRKVVEARRQKYGLAPRWQAPSSPLNTPTSTSAMTGQQAMKTVKDIEAALDATSGPNKACITPTVPPNRKAAVEAALNRKPSVLNLSRATSGITMVKSDEHRKLLAGGIRSPWIDQDPNKPSFMKSVEVSMEGDDAIFNVFAQRPPHGSMVPKSFQSAFSTGRFGGSCNNPTSAPTSTPINGCLSSNLRSGNKLTYLRMVEQGTQTDASLTADFGFSKESAPDSGSFGNAGSSTSTFRCDNDDQAHASKNSSSFHSCNSSPIPSLWPSTMSLGCSSLSPVNPFDINPAFHNLNTDFGCDVLGHPRSPLSVQQSVPASLDFNSLFQSQHLRAGTSFPSTATQSFNSSGGTTTTCSTPTQSFIEGVAGSGGLGTGNPGVVSEIGNGTAMYGNGIGLGNGTGSGENNMFAFQSSRLSTARKWATPRGRHGCKR